MMNKLKQLFGLNWIEMKKKISLILNRKRNFLIDFNNLLILTMWFIFLYHFSWICPSPVAFAQVFPLFCPNLEIFFFFFLGGHTAPFHLIYHYPHPVLALTSALFWVLCFLAQHGQHLQEPLWMNGTVLLGHMTKGHPPSQLVAWEVVEGEESLDGDPLLSPRGRVQSAIGLQQELDLLLINYRMGRQKLS